MARKREAEEIGGHTFDGEDDTGVFQRLLDDGRAKQQIAHRLLRAVANRDGEKRLLIATHDEERALALGRALVKEGLCDALDTAPDARTALARIKANVPSLIVADAALVEVLGEAIGDPLRVYTLNGNDDHTVEEIKQST